MAYYFVDSVQEGKNYSITGRVPIMLNGVRSNLFLVFDNDHPYGFIAGAGTDYVGGETDTVAKESTGLEIGDKIEFVCDYYDYDGNYLDSYLFGDVITYNGDHTISNVYLSNGKASAMYMFRDFYGEEYWTPEIPD